MLIVSMVMDVVLLLIYSQYEADNEDLQQAEDDYVVEEQSEHGSRGHRQPSTTSVDRWGNCLTFAAIKCRKKAKSIQLFDAAASWHSAVIPCQ